MAIKQQSNKLRGMMRVSVTDKKQWQQRRIRYCKDGCRRQESDNAKNGQWQQRQRQLSGDNECGGGGGQLRSRPERQVNFGNMTQD